MSPGGAFRLFACCVAVRGARRSTICDVQRQRYRLIPNGLYDILTVHRDLTLDGIRAAFGADEAETIEQYFAFLAANDFGFWTDTPESFPEMDMSWEAPERVTNAVIDVAAHSPHDFASLFRQLDALGCKMLQLRYFDPVAPDRLDAVLELARRGRLRTIELLIPWSPAWTDDHLRGVCIAHGRVASVTVHGAPANRKVETPSDVRIAMRAQTVDSADHCGEVHPAYFTTNVRLFTEAQLHNTCLNRKLSVDQDGEIRNCPALPRSFGNAADTPLHRALEAEGFQDLWRVNKDQVEVCRDCEFRYVCTDCRAFVADSAHPHPKPAKCAYDPYTAEWRRAEPSPIVARPALPVLAGV
ncbi:MAG TPA: grasp-with-spasm system SPASM domain peptide maturase [Myxococcaceae bacterium]|jgi:SPASM domain peptide maturase of grasp-with-spasm system